MRIRPLNARIANNALAVAIPITLIITTDLGYAIAFFIVTKNPGPGLITPINKMVQKLIINSWSVLILPR
ncbi:hypothetical protein XBI1_1570112 [Xenorhabdus bovienii str. Intermedium]|uniref:Uncharacterized protein n=1 Tax=Xenorhabdus bovienii str. Intermedium TaxID=1379677 RepID=A0A077QEU6_XENBV|nr:hypothetical protein XBI1_1570112 [Xenorhabdus bovienii str. Intermedium]